MEDKKFDAGVSNTPAHAPLKIFTTIDYLKFRFDLDNNESIAKLNPIYKILGVKIEDAQKKPGMNGYENTLKLAPGISLWYGGNATKNYLGQGTTNRSTHIIKDPKTKKLRILTPIECERLNQFPDNWTNSGMPDRMRYFCMGNALVVPMITRIGRVLDSIIAVEP